jgi:hypothetical protein
MTNSCSVQNAQCRRTGFVQDRILDMCTQIVKPKFQELGVLLKAVVNRFASEFIWTSTTPTMMLTEYETKVASPTYPTTHGSAAVD